MTVPDANDSDAVRALIRGLTDWTVPNTFDEVRSAAPGLILALLARAEMAEAERDALREHIGQCDGSWSCPASLHIHGCYRAAAERPR